jgi:hypothetical protein
MLNSLVDMTSKVEAKVICIRIREHTLLGKRAKASLLGNGCYIEMVQTKYRWGL